MRQELLLQNERDLTIRLIAWIELTYLPYYEKYSYEIIRESTFL